MTVVTERPPGESADPHTAGPIVESLAAVQRLSGGMRVQFGLARAAGGPWQRCVDLLADPTQFDQWRRALGQWLGERHPGPVPERTTAGYVMSWYLQVPGFLSGLLFHTARRVPSLRPEDLAFQLSSDRPHPEGVALLAPGFACLPDDPAAGTPEATVVADEHALAALLRARFAGHAARFVTAFAPTTRLGRRVLWGAATDALDNAGWLAGKLCGDEGSGVADSALLLPALEHPFTAPSTLRALRDEGSGRTVWTRRRESCCFHYALPDEPACVTCPRVRDEERAQRVLAES